MARRNLKGRRVLITGASAGIGRALASALAGRGARLMVNARREQRLVTFADELSSRAVDVKIVAGDITREAVRQEIAHTIGEHWGALDILVNNAGIGAIGPFEGSDPGNLARIFDVNFFAPVALIRGLLPLLRCGTDAAIVNLGSVLGHVAAPYKSEYCASKFALRGFSNALRMELRESGIGVLMVSPSTTASEFFDHALQGSSGIPPEAESEGRLEAESRATRWAMTPEYVARHIVDAVERRKREIFLPPASGWIMPLLHACPALAEWLARRWSPLETQQR